MCFGIESQSRRTASLHALLQLPLISMAWDRAARFGGHAAKAVGSAINHACKHSFELVMTVGSLTSLGVALSHERKGTACTYAESVARATSARSAGERSLTTLAR